MQNIWYESSSVNLANLVNISYLLRFQRYRIFSRPY